MLSLNKRSLGPRRYRIQAIQLRSYDPFEVHKQDDWVFTLLHDMFSSVAQSCPTLCNPINLSTPGLPVHHQLPEFTQTHVRRVGDPHPAISSSVIPFSSCLQSFPASGSFSVSQFFTSGGQNIGVSASTSVLVMNIQD